jgi:hypothetical protein
MIKLPRVAACLPALLAVLASGCGSTDTASTTTIASTPTTASTNTGNTGTTLPAVKNAKTATQSTAAKQPTHTTVAPPTPQRRAAEDERKRKEGALENSAEIEQAARASSEKAPPHQYPRFFQIRFIVSCEAAKGSHSSCECILTKLEKSPVEKGQSLGELIALELEFKKGVPIGHVAGLMRRVQRDTNECRSK